MAAYFEPFFACGCLAVSGGTYKLLLYYETNSVCALFVCVCVYVFGDIHLTLPLFELWTLPSDTRRGFLSQVGPCGS